MATFWQKAQLYLGLVDEEELNEVSEEPAVVTTPQVRTVTQPPRERSTGRRVEPPAGGRRRSGVEAPSDGIMRTGGVRPVPAGDVQCDIIDAVDFADAKMLADRIRDRQPVILNLRETDPDLVRRLVDFASGLVYALDGTMRKATEGVILVMPPRMSLGREERRRLADLGLYGDTSS